jgi:hypothetical protein
VFIFVRRRTGNTNAICENTADLQSGNFSDLNSACSKMLVIVIVTAYVSYRDSYRNVIYRIFLGRGKRPILFYTSFSSINKLITMFGNFYPLVRQYHFSMLVVAFQKIYSAQISWRSMPTILVKIYEFLGCCLLIVLALTLPLSLLLFAL